MAKNESNFWQQVKKNLKEFQWLRLESWASQGVPDLLGTTKNGQLFTVELKVIKSNKPNISPHQIAFHLQRKNSPCFILISSLVQSTSKKSQLYLVPSSELENLLDEGLSSKYLCSSFADVGQRIKNYWGDWRGVGLSLHCWFFYHTEARWLQGFRTKKSPNDWSHSGFMINKLWSLFAWIFTDVVCKSFSIKFGVIRLQ